MCKGGGAVVQGAVGDGGGCVARVGVAHSVVAEGAGTARPLSLPKTPKPLTFETLVKNKTGTWEMIIGPLI